MRLRLASVRAGRTPWADDACADWGRRIQRYFPFEEALLKPSDAERETKKLLEGLPARARLVVLDERGQDLTSTGLSGWLEQAAMDGVPEFWFAIGGAYGHAQAARDRAWRTLRLSCMVLNHAVARVVMMEQLYRACTIRAGEPYHHGD